MGIVKGVFGAGRSQRPGADGEHPERVKGLQALLPDAVVPSAAGRMLFQRDGAVSADAPPAAVVLPSNEAELVAAVRYCHDHGLEIVPRGGATSLRGGAVGDAGSVVIATTRLNRIMEVNRRDRLVKAEAGAMLMSLGEAARDVGLRLATAPAGRSPATLGGAIAKNVRGRVGAGHGAIVSDLERVRMIAANGEIVEIGGEVQSGGGYDLAGLVAGSEGTLGLISEATVRLWPAFPAVRLIVGRFRDEEQALAAAEAVLARGLATGIVEVVGGALWGGQSAGLGDWSGAEDDAFVLVEIEGGGHEVAAGAAAIREALGEGAQVRVEETADAAVRRAVWALRERGPVHLARGRIVGVSDIVVPVSQVGDVAKGLRGIGKSHQLSCIGLMQPAVGGIQSLFVADDRDEASAARVEAAIDQAVALAAEVGGLATGDFGAGVLKAARSGYGGLDQTAFAMQHLIKAVFDGEGAMNPGKVLMAVDAP